MFQILFLTIFTSLSAGLLPPGFVVRQFGHTRDKVSSVKIEERVVFGEDAVTLNETIYFLKPNYFKVTAERSGESVTLIRKGSECEFSSSGRKITGASCSGLKSNFYYNLLLPYGSELDYFKSLNIDTRDGFVSIRKNESGEYVIPDGVIMAKDGKTLIFIVGLDNKDYNTALEESKSEKDVLAAILDNIKERSPQIWFDKTNFFPLRVYGKKNGGDKVEILFSSYLKDALEFPFPSKVTLLVNDKEKASYSVRSFESGVKLSDSFFVQNSQQGVDISSLSDNKKKLIEYLQDYR